MHQKHLLNLTIKTLIGEASADERLTLHNLVKDHPANAFFVATVTKWFNAGQETDDEQSKRLFERIKNKIKS